MDGYGRSLVVTIVNRVCYVWLGYSRLGVVIVGFGWLL